MFNLRLKNYTGTFFLKNYNHILKINLYFLILSANTCIDLLLRKLENNTNMTQR